jgi:long-chain acyl-CoA synthetase
VRDLIKAELEKYSKDFRSYEKPKNFILISEDFSTENGMLTPKMSVRRNKVLQNYQAALDKLY